MAHDWNNGSPADSKTTSCRKCGMVAKCVSTSGLMRSIHVSRGGMEYTIGDTKNIPDCNVAEDSGYFLNRIMSNE